MKFSISNVESNELLASVESGAHVASLSSQITLSMDVDMTPPLRRSLWNNSSVYHISSPYRIRHQIISTSTIQHKSNEDVSANCEEDDDPLSNSTPISVALRICNDQILVHYNHLIALFALRNPFASFKLWSRCLSTAFNTIHLFAILVLLSIGYVMNYAACFRQDRVHSYDVLDQNEIFDSDTLSPFVTFPMRDESPILTNDVEFGYSSLQSKEYVSDQISFDSVKSNLNKLGQLMNYRANDVNLHNGFAVPSHRHRYLYRCQGSFISSYFIPTALHMLAYIISLIVMRDSESDSMENLTVYTYLMVCQTCNSNRTIKMMSKTICQWLGFALLCMSLSMLTHALHIFMFTDLCFTFVQPSTTIGFNFIKSFSFFLFTLIDTISIIIFLMYAVHCQMIIMYLKNTETALRQRRITFQVREYFYRILLNKIISFIQELAKSIEILKTTVKNLNKKHSLGVWVLLLYFVSRLIRVILVLLTDSFESEPNSKLLAILSMIFWLCLITMPLYQASRVSGAWSSIRQIGQEFKANPFCYKNVPSQEIDSILSYTSSLNIKAQIFKIPVQTSCIAGLILMLIFTLLIMGQKEQLHF